MRGIYDGGGVKLEADLDPRKIVWFMFLFLFIYVESFIHDMKNWFIGYCQKQMNDVSRAI